MREIALMVVAALIAAASLIGDQMTVELPTPDPVLGYQLILATDTGNIALATDLIAQGADIEVRDERQRTPLMAATQGNQIEIAGMLINAGADVNAKDDMQDSPYLLAGARGYNEILVMTLANGADLTSTNRFGGTAMIPACERGHVETVRILLDAGVAVDHVNNLGWTCLLEAIILSDGGPAHQQIVQMLVDAGADVNLGDFDGVTPLQHAESRGYTEIAAILRAAGAH